MSKKLTKSDRLTGLVTSVDHILAEDVGKFLDRELYSNHTRDAGLLCQQYANAHLRAFVRSAKIAGFVIHHHRGERGRLRYTITRRKSKINRYAEPLHPDFLKMSMRLDVISDPDLETKQQIIPVLATIIKTHGRANVRTLIKELRAMTGLALSPSAIRDLAPAIGARIVGGRNDYAVLEHTPDVSPLEVLLSERDEIGIDELQAAYPIDTQRELINKAKAMGFKETMRRTDGTMTRVLIKEMQ